MAPFEPGYEQSDAYKAAATKGWQASRAATRAEIDAIMDKRTAGMDLDEQIIALCAAAWRRASLGQWRNKQAVGESGAGKGGPLVRESADVILARHGITFDADNRLYALYERAIRRHALAQLEETPQAVAARQARERRAEKWRLGA